ncbi:M14 family zinc carboxypeptidase [Sedimentibacter sp.]|uniref:M14 family zinc carboxypeptidase n=1 Tax=Sedimentibacter sp. TaxID=1960295 RepID=UPI0028B15E11|nr:M14 family zinc carboxypeptidase [Sedimentibacter sp.]
MNISKIIDNVPDYKVFLTVDELNESTLRLQSKYPDIVKVFEAGKSRENHSILCLKIGSGSKNAFCFACPHPNEPIGAMTLEYLSWALAEDDEFRESTGYTWYIIKCVDPDGTKLNEKWFKGPFTIYNYMKDYFRPGSEQQVEWTFPIDYKNLHFNEPMPETKAIMGVIEKTRPEFMYSLHNGGLCGAYWYITHEYEDIYDELRETALKNGVALQLGEPESPACIEFSDAIYKMSGISEDYDYLEKYSGKNPEKSCYGGTSSSDYALRFNDCVSLMTELPYFSDDRIADSSITNITRRQSIEDKLKNTVEHYRGLDRELSKVRKYIAPDNPFTLLVEQIISEIDSSVEAQKKWSDDPKFERPAKSSEVFDNDLVSKFYNSLSTSLCARACQQELDKLKKEGCKDDEALCLLEEVYEVLSDNLKNECEYLENKLNYKVVPIRDLVRIQIECGLIVARRRQKKEY